MNVEVLECFLHGRHIGRFERRYLTRVDFVYDNDAPQDISLSLPREGARKQHAARRFLENLLPETPGAKRLMREHSGAVTADSFDLLQRVGGDVAGAVQLMPEGQSPEEWTAPPVLARTNAIAGRVRTIKVTGTPESGYDHGVWPLRFSLAGVQAKFALADVDGEWFWPDAGTPSTHILKPEATQQAGIERVEAAALCLARLAGVPASLGKVMTFGDQTSFIVNRFDRQLDADGVATRLHVEDAIQAYGEEVGFKYYLGAEEIVEMLCARGSDESAYQFVQQLAFNVGVKNADAHGKNYSFVYDTNGLAGMSPLYDVIPMGFFPGYAQHLSMPISHEEQMVRVSGDHWRAFAVATGLDVERVSDVVAEVSAGILAHVDVTLGALSLPHRETSIAEIKRYNERIHNELSHTSRQGAPPPR